MLSRKQFGPTRAGNSLSSQIVVEVAIHLVYSTLMGIGPRGLRSASRPDKGSGNTEPFVYFGIRRGEKNQEVNVKDIDGRTKYNELHAPVKIWLGDSITKNLAECVCLHKSGELK